MKISKKKYRKLLLTNLKLAEKLKRENLDREMLDRLAEIVWALRELRPKLRKGGKNVGRRTNAEMEEYKIEIK